MIKLFFEGQCKREQSQARLSSAECSLNSIFYQLIRVAIGTQDTLSRPPSRGEWAELYAMAKKQSLVGICFAGLQKLYNSVNQEPSTQNPQPNSTQNKEPRTQNLDEVLYLTWMGMAAKIQQRNEVVNKQCVEIQSAFDKDGLKTCVLKGQGVATLYNTLSALRQSGDIDLWVDGTASNVLKFLHAHFDVGRVLYHHADINAFPDTEVEVHFVPTWMYTPRKERVLRRFFSELRGQEFENFNDYGFCQSSLRFNRVFLLLHAYRHYVAEGLGLRQVMDYYFTLSKGFSKEERIETMVILRKLGVHKFTAGMMNILQSYFGLRESCLLCEPDSIYGAKLLDEIMNGGNFGHGNNQKAKINGIFSSFKVRYGRQLETMRDNPSELLWAPLWRLWHFVWRLRYE